MDFLQIRDDRKLSDRKRECIDQLKSIMAKGDNYNLIKLPYFKNIVDTVNESDRLRNIWLENFPFGCYVDDDCFVNYRYVPPSDGYMRLPRYRKGESLPDIFMVYRNASEYWFRKNFNQKERIRVISERSLSGSHEHFYGWPHSMMQKWGGFEFLPDDLYEHSGETMRDLTIQRKGISL